MRASWPSSVARRRPSALTTPWPLKRSVPSACEPPSKLASPPYSLALAPTTAKPWFVKSTRPFAPTSSGVSGEIRTSLPASATLPFTVAVSTFISGIARLSVRSAAPVAVLVASALSIQPPAGELLTMRSISASGPRPAASSASTGSPSRLRMVACTFGKSIPPSWVRPLRSSSVPRSSARSTFAFVNSGQVEVNAGVLPAAGRLGTNAKLASSIFAAMRNSPSFELFALKNGNSHRSPLTRKVALASLPPCTACSR